jgi:hypothetical protein
VYEWARLYLSNVAYVRRLSLVLIGLNMLGLMEKLKLQAKLYGNQYSLRMEDLNKNLRGIH